MKECLEIYEEFVGKILEDLSMKIPKGILEIFLKRFIKNFQTKPVQDFPKKILGGFWNGVYGAISEGF